MDQNQEHKPVIIEDKTAGLQNIVREFYPDDFNGETITDIEYKKADLLRRMRDDEDMYAYPKLINILMIFLAISAVFCFYQTKSWLSIAIGLAGIIMILTARYKIKVATQELVLYRDHFDSYVWEGLKLKQLRHLLVKSLYLLIFPFIMILFAFALHILEFSFSYWAEFILAIGLSSLAWWYVFEDDRKLILKWKAELLEILPFDPENPGF